MNHLKNKDESPNLIGPMPTWRRTLAAIVAVVGLFFVGQTLLKAFARPIAITVTSDAPIDSLHISVRSGGEEQAGADIRPQNGTTELRHELQLPSGAYDIHVSIVADGIGYEATQPLLVPSQNRLQFAFNSKGNR